jgi:hypothetical protein
MAQVTTDLTSQRHAPTLQVEKQPPGLVGVSVTIFLYCSRSSGSLVLDAAPRGHARSLHSLAPFHARCPWPKLEPSLSTHGCGANSRGRPGGGRSGTGMDWAAVAQPSAWPAV